MFERFSNASRRVVVLAQDEARSFGHGYVGTEHLLLGVLVAGDSPAARVLLSFGITDEDVRQAVEQHIGRGDEPADEEIAFSPRAKAAIEAAFHVAQPRATLVEPVHLLLGALSQQGARACEVLELFGVEPQVLMLGLSHRLGTLVRGFSRLLRPAESMLPRSLFPTMQVGDLELLDRLSDAALAGVAAAQHEARRLGQDSLSAEFLVFGLLATEGEARDVLIAVDASEHAAREALESVCSPADALDVGPLPPDESVRQALSDCQAASPRDLPKEPPGQPIRSSDLLRASLARSVGAWLLLRAAGADLTALKKLTRAYDGGSEAGTIG